MKQLMLHLHKEIITVTWLLGLVFVTATLQAQMSCAITSQYSNPCSNSLLESAATFESQSAEFVHFVESIFHKKSNQCITPIPNIMHLSPLDLAFTEVQLIKPWSIDQRITSIFKREVLRIRLLSSIEINWKEKDWYHLRIVCASYKQNFNYEHETLFEVMTMLATIKMDMEDYIGAINMFEELLAYEQFKASPNRDKIEYLRALVIHRVDVILGRKCIEDIAASQSHYYQKSAEGLLSILD